MTRKLLESNQISEKCVKYTQKMSEKCVIYLVYLYRCDEFD